MTGTNESGWIAIALPVGALAAAAINVYVVLRIQNAVLRMNADVLNAVEKKYVRKDVYHADLKRIEAGIARAS